MRRIGGLISFRIISRRSVITEPCPLCPRKRTKSGHRGMSALCQKRTHAPQESEAGWDERGN